jgi:predicted nuclease with RNAse H fold
MARPGVGIDVGAERLHCVAIDDSRRLVDAALFAPSERPDLLRWLESAQCVAIDAPSSLSSSPHADEPGLSPKFRAARCAEIALGREWRIWVPWVTPTPAMPVPSWMRVGLRLFDAVEDAGHTAIEVFPYAGFRALAGGSRLPSKSTIAGIKARALLLQGAGASVPSFLVSSHDLLDAALAALVALHHRRGIATSVGCGHDDSAIWLP